ncbi:MAG TPA: putative zinc-binding metallopeptidase [Candidatus Methylacidiphilales bacterium]|nr:putative zinc-binding metallopeptidase [Candidatus Methylacidiphilales bacterium]
MGEWLAVQVRQKLIPCENLSLRLWQRIFFENITCVSCQRELGFLPDLLCLSTLESKAGSLFSPTAKEAGRRFYRKCRNYSVENACNWMIPEDNRENYCVSCRLDEMIPDLSIEKNRTLWKLIEAAKRRLVYTLISLELPLLNRADDPHQGISFRFLAEGPTPESKVLTGHDKGIITLNIAEADDAEREKRRLSMKETYRTLLGHFRHEIGHYYWDRLIGGTKYLEPYRALFGDERIDYDQALKTYYASGATENWQEKYISVYASAHPWEDWAESWAHYLHIQDTLEVALDFCMVDARVALESKETSQSSWFGMKSKTFEEKIDAWSELTIALNSINRSMGLRDIYPFVLSPVVVEKLRFISEVIADRQVGIRNTPSAHLAAEPAGPPCDAHKPIDSNLALAVPTPA